MHSSTLSLLARRLRPFAAPLGAVRGVLLLALARPAPALEVSRDESPAKAGIPLHETVASFGRFKLDTRPIAETAEDRKATSGFVDKVGFDH